ncbi:hypothetical protein EalM132_00169 [Exiguobacterium phage vB_EalM-132]|nr:hypothetical protein EalM132_00169 [Exiguobacterium phage vB_EalM-132]
MRVFGVTGQYYAHEGVNCLVIQYVGAKHGFMNVSIVSNKPWR